MKMTKTFALAALMAGSLLAGTTLQAQDAPPHPTPPNAPGGPGGPGGPGMRGRPNFDQIAKQLDLTDDQKPKVKAVLDEQQQKMNDLRKDTATAPEDKRAKAKEIRDSATAKLKEILTPEQFAKWQKMGPARQRPAGAGGPPPADAPKPPQ